MLKHFLFRWADQVWGAVTLGDESQNSGGCYILSLQVLALLWPPHCEAWLISGWWSSFCLPHSLHGNNLEIGEREINWFVLLYILVYFKKKKKKGKDKAVCFAIFWKVTRCASSVSWSIDSGSQWMLSPAQSIYILAKGHTEDCVLEGPWETIRSQSRYLGTQGSWLCTCELFIYCLAYGAVPKGTWAAQNNSMRKQQYFHNEGMNRG